MKKKTYTVSTVPKAVSPNVGADTTLAKFHKVVTSSKYKKVITGIRALPSPEEPGISDTEHKKRKRVVNTKKKPLPCITCHSRFPENSSKRKKVDGVGNTGLCNVDIDGLANRQEAEALKERAEDLIGEHIAFSMVSPSGRGVKFLIPIPEELMDYTWQNFATKVFTPINEWFKAKMGVDYDPACKTFERLCFYSWDPEARINSEAVPPPMAELELYAGKDAEPDPSEQPWPEDKVPTYLDPSTLIGTYNLQADLPLIKELVGRLVEGGLWKGKKFFRGGDTAGNQSISWDYKDRKLVKVWSSEMPAVSQDGKPEAEGAKDHFSAFDILVMTKRKLKADGSRDFRQGWDVLKRQVVNDLADGGMVAQDALTTGELPTIYYGGFKKGYHAQTPDDNWTHVDVGSVASRLKKAGVPEKLGPGQSGEIIDDHILKIQNGKAVSYASKFSGRLSGLIEAPGRTLLATEDYPEVEPQEGDWSAIRRVLDSVSESPSGSGQETAEHRDRLLLFAQSAVLGLHQALCSDLITQSVALVLVGSAGSGKSVWQYILGRSLGSAGMGGSLKSAAKSDSGFSGELVPHAHLYMGDADMEGDKKRVNRMTGLVKELVANEEMNVHFKGDTPFDMPLFRRISMSLNMDVDSLLGLPILNEGNRDKFVIINTGASRLDDDGLVKETRKPLIDEQIPAFVWYLINEYQCSNPSLIDPRFGQTKYITPSFNRQVLEGEDCFGLVEWMIEQADQGNFDGPGDQKVETVSDLVQKTSRKQLKLATNVWMQRVMGDDSVPGWVGSRNLIRKMSDLTRFFEQYSHSFPDKLYREKGMSKRWVLVLG